MLLALLASSFTETIGQGSGQLGSELQIDSPTNPRPRRMRTITDNLVQELAHILSTADPASIAQIPESAIVKH
jgi:hypothetical protein